MLKGVWPGIGADDRVLLWGGGIWRWLDAITPIKAVERLAAEGRRVHLFFLGCRAGRRPTGELIPTSAGTGDRLRPPSAGWRAVRPLQRGWVPYEERQSYLREADLGISAHHDHLEARFSFRTRVLDYLWAGLPMVLTRGDSMGELVERAGLGATVAPEDDEGFASACAALLDDRALRGNRRAVREVAPSFRWAQAASPLVDYCLNHRSRPAPRRHPLAVSMATYGQYPASSPSS